MNNRPLDLLEKIVEEINNSNKDGKLDYMAEAFNWELQLLGLDIIRKGGK